MELFLWSTFYFAIVFCASKAFAGLQTRKWVKLALFPGVLLHAGCRALGCLVSYAPVKGVDFFRDRRPFLRPGDTRIPGLGHVLSAYGTHMALFLVFFLQCELVPVADWEAFYFPAFSDLRTRPGLIGSYWDTLRSQVPVGHLSFWVGCYVFLGVCVSFDVRIQELVGVLCVTVCGLWFCGVLSYLGVGFRFFSRGWFMTWLHVPEWLGVASYYVLAVTGSVAAVLVFSGLVKMGDCALKGRYATQGATAPRRERKHAVKT